MPSRPYDVIIMAGQDAAAPLPSAQAGLGPKALLPLQGQPMVRYLLDAFAAWGHVRRLVIVGLSPQELPLDGLGLEPVFVPNSGGVIANLNAGLQALGTAEPLLVASADIPLLTPAAIEDLVQRCEAQPIDLGYPIVRREVMEARFPGSGRTFPRLAEGAFAGGDLFYLRPAVLLDNAGFFAGLSARRKSAWALARLIGAAIPVRYVLGRLRIAHVERRVQRLLGARCRAIISPYPELAMDVDKPHHLELVSRVLSGMA